MMQSAEPLGESPYVLAEQMRKLAGMLNLLAEDKETGGPLAEPPDAGS